LQDLQVRIYSNLLIQSKMTLSIPISDQSQNKLPPFVLVEAQTEALNDPSRDSHTWRDRGITDAIYLANGSSILPAILPVT